MVKMRYFKLMLLALILFSCAEEKKEENKRNTITMFIAGDSTVADYAKNYDEGEDYYKTRYPVTGWGQVIQPLLTAEELRKIPFITADSVVVDCRARGGRSTRTFFQEGRWRGIVEDIEPGDVVLMQFGHNDGSTSPAHAGRYVDVEGYKEFLRLFVSQTKERGGIPVILTPVARAFPWKDGALVNVHGDYPQAAIAVAEETNTFSIDLNALSLALFNEKGKEFIEENYFMNFPVGKYEGYPEGSSDNTHFQTQGGIEVAKLVVEGMENLMPISTSK
ncbi:MAG: rhamnogalacturonan acetylesterase [Mangrovibacterium sp.]